MLDAGRKSEQTEMKGKVCHINKISALLCMVGILPLSAQEQKEEKEIRLNMDAVKMIQFDFNGDRMEYREPPKEAPLEKKWMNFKEDLSMPRNLIDTTKIWKPTGYIRFEPYTIWTKFGEDPVYDVLVMGRPKKLEFSWTLNPNAVYGEEYGRSIMPSTGKMYQSVTGSAGAGVGIGGLDIMGFAYNNLTRRGRMLAHNRKHANAWKIYKDYKPTKEDSLKVMNFYRKPLLAVYHTKDTDTIARPEVGDTLMPQENTDTKKPSRPKSEGNLYEYIRQRQAEDSIRRQKRLRKEKNPTNPYEVERQIRRIREMND